MIKITYMQLIVFIGRLYQSELPDPMSRIYSNQTS